MTVSETSSPGVVARDGADTGAPAPHRQTRPSTPTEALRRARGLRRVIAQMGADIDRAAVDPAAAMGLIGDEGLAALVVPVEFGGLWRGWESVAALLETMLEISAGDGSVGQVWSQSMGMACSLFTAPGLPPLARRQIADELLHEGRRLVASNAETGTAGRVVARRVEGGILIDGAKSFNTGSGRGGRDIAVVGLRLLADESDPTSGSMHRALVRLDDPGVEAGHDWDAMGQRSTISQRVTYRNVFVPDGWHFTAEPPGAQFLPFARCMHAAVLQGIGEGALRAAVDLVRELDRPALAQSRSAHDDVTLHRRIGVASCDLAASRALVLQAAHDIAHFAPPADPADVIAAGIRARVAATRSALNTATAIFELTGARSTSERYRLDRFWRNARTLSAHDPLDASTALLGRHIIDEALPPLDEYFRVG